MNLYLCPIRLLIAAAIAAAAATPQPAPATSPTFEAASLKLYEDPFHRIGAGQGRFTFVSGFRHEGGPGTPDPVRIHYIMLLTGLLAQAFEVTSQQIRLPSTFDEGVFEVNAAVPPGATIHEGHLMLRHLLVTRFGIQYHQEKTRVAGFALVADKHGAAVSASGIPRGSPASPNSYGTDGRPTPALIGVAGIRSIVENAGWSVVFERQTMSQLAAYLAERRHTPVMDLTGLTGQYDFLLRFFPPEWPLPPIDSPVKYFPSLESVLRGQLGIKLVHKKQDGPLIVIDKIATEPTVD